MSEVDETVRATVADGGDNTRRTHFTITIKDTTPGVTVSPTSLALTELGTSNTVEKTYTVVLDTDPGVNVTITAASGDASAAQVKTGSGSLGNSATLTFTHGDSGNWNTAQTVTVRALNDADTANESFNITHVATAASGPYNGISIDPVAVTTQDTANDVTIAGGKPVREGAKARFTVSTIRNVEADLTVHLTVSDASGSDFIAAGDEGSKSVTIAKGTKSAIHEVQTVGDATDEPHGDITVAIVNDAAYATGSPSSATVRVNDDDGVPTNGLSFPSGGESESLQVAASFNASGRPYRVRWGVGSAGTATYSKSGADYAMGSTASERWNSPGSGGHGYFSWQDYSPSGIVTRTVHLNVHNDTVDEPDETIVVNVQARGNPGPVNIDRSYTYTIEDDDPTVVSLARVGSATAINEGEKVEFTVTLGRALVAGEVIDAPLSIGGTGVTTGDWSLATKSGAANTGVTLHDTGTATPKVRFSGAGAHAATLELTATADGTADAGETFSIALGADSAFDAAGLGTNVGGGADPHSMDNAFSVTVNEVPTLSIDLGRASVAEGHAGNTDVTINYKMSPAHSAQFPFWACVDTAASTATHRAASGGKAADWNLVHFHSLTPVTLNADGGKCHLYNYPGNGTLQNFKLRVFGDRTAEGNETAVVTIKRAPGTPAGVVLGTSSATLTINNDDGAVPTITVSGGAAVTEGTGAQFTVHASPAPAANLTVDLTVSDAGGSSDFVAAGNEGAKTVTILAGQTSATYTVPTVGDQVGEPNGQVTVALVAPAEGYTVGAASSATTAVNDDDLTQPRVFLNSLDITFSVQESVGTRFLRVGFARPPGNEALTEDLAVSYTLGGTATAGTDYTIAGADHQAGTGTFTLPSGTKAFVASTAFPITILDDALVEDSETIVLTLVDGADYDLGTGTTATITITDDEPTLSLAPPAPTTVAEGDALTVGVTLSAARSTDTAVRVLMTALTATGGAVDFDSGALTLTVPAGETTATGTVRTVEDTVCEADETFRVAIDASRWPAGVRLGSPRKATITIEDDDTCTVGFESAAWSVAEGGAVSVTVHIDPARSVDTKVGLVYRDASRADPVYGEDGRVNPDAYSDWRRGVDTAHRFNTAYSHVLRIGFGQDYAAAPARITIPAHATSHTFTVRTVDEPPRLVASGRATNSVVEPDETFTIALGSLPDRHTKGAHPTTTVTIHDNDGGPPVSIARAGAARVDEGAAARFVVTATPAPAQPFAVTVEVTDSGRFAASGQTGRREVTVGTDGTGALTVATVDDQTAEDHGTLTARLRSGAYRDGAEREAVVRVSDDDIEGELAPFVSTLTPLPEGAYLDFNLALAKRLDGDQTLTLPLTFGGTATRGTDYRLVCVESSPAGAGTCNGLDGASPSVTFHGAHMTGRRVTGPLRLEVIEDGTAESSETVDLSLGGGRVQTITLKDAPSSVTLTFARGTYSVREGSLQLAAFLRVDAAPGRAIEVPLVFTDLTATAGADYEAPATATFPASGVTFHGFRIPLIDDTAHESDETFRMAIDASRLPDWVTLGTHGEAVVTIEDDDPAGPALWLAPSKVTVDEGLTGTWTVRLATEPTGTVTVAIASDNADVTTSPAQLTFARTGTNLWSTPQTVTVSAAHDTGDGAADDAATLTHSASGGGYAGITGTVAVAVNDDDTAAAPPGVTVSATTLSLAEGGAAGSYTVVLDAAPSADVTVTATPDDAGAVKVHTAGGTPGASATLTFTPATWASAQALTVTPQDDADADDETVTIAHAVSPTGGYANVTAASVAVAVDDDETPTVPNACDPDDVQGDVEGYVLETQHGQVHVNRWKRVLAAFGVDNGATAMTAAEAQTHADKGWTRWDPVVTVLTCLEGGTSTGPLVTVTGGAGITEGGNALFTVSASPAPTANLTVTLTVDDDATSDFLHTSHEGTQSVTIQANQNSATLTLPTVSDGIDEPDGSVRATVAGGTNYRIGTPSTATVAVSDDDDPPQAPVVRIAAGGAITEGGTATFTLSATPPPTSPLTVDVQVTETGAFAQGGQTGTREATISTGGTGTLTVVTVNDSVDEPDGSLTATVQTGTGYTPHPSQGAATVAVLDNDVTPEVRITGGGAITEGGTATFTLTATPPPASALTVGVQVTQTGSFAKAGQTGTKQVPVGTDGTGTLTVATADDSADEPNGSLTATVRTGAGYTPHSTNGSATVAVADNDAPAGVPVVSIGDARAREGDRLMRFTVRLSRAAREPVTVYYRTRESSPVSAREGVDYYPVSFLLRFRPGDTEHWFTVFLANDGHDEGDETFEVKLGAVYGGGAVLGDNVAVGTIENDDPMPKAWLARFGRTAAEQALDGIAGRMAAPRTAGAHGTIAGQALAFGAADDDVAAGGAGFSGTGPLALSSLDTPVNRFGAGGPGHDDAGFGHHTPPSRTLTLGEALLGSNFTATGQTDATGGSLALWGRAAQSAFDGREGAFSLDGEATTAMLGADYARGDWLLGLALMQSAGEGEYRDTGGAPHPASQGCPEGVDEALCAGAVREGDGEVDASLTAALPYASLQASERLALWGALGIGAGEVTLETAMDQRLDAGLDWTMAAAGARSALLSAQKEGSGPALALTTDALWARTRSDATHELAASDSDVTRLRLGFEGSYRFATEGDGHLTPKVEVGARHDGGDAETGFGVELGGGLAWSDPTLGLSLDLSGRTLIAHDSDALEDQGFAASLGFDPNPASARGPSLKLRQTLGGQAEGGLDALFTPDPLSERTGGGTTTGRWTAEAAWGLSAFSGRFTASPHLGLSLGTGTRDYTLGWRLTPGTGADAPELSLGVKATRRQSEGAAPEHAVGVELRTQW